MRKKLFDIVGASLLLLIATPLMVLIWLCVRATSAGPAIFRQTRIGYLGRPFVIFKFRTMRYGSGRTVDQVLPGDVRVTGVGRFLRKTHLDELPQLLNVLMGDMSLVGPRPLTESSLMKLVGESPAMLQCLSARPGLTGLTQIRGRLWRVQRGVQGILRLDFFYMNHECLWLDLLILARTVQMVLRGKGV